MIEVSVRQNDGRIRVSVKDNGNGMPAGFNISEAGTLGLKLVRTLVQQQLKGSIEINTENGTEMNIEFPANMTGE